MTGGPVSLVPASDEYYDLGSFGHTITTTSADTQTSFNRGLTWVYSFNHVEGAYCFEQAIAHDPACAMAYSGVSRTQSAQTTTSRGRSSTTETSTRAFNEASMPRERPKNMQWMRVPLSKLSSRPFNSGFRPTSPRRTTEHLIKAMLPL